MEIEKEKIVKLIETVENRALRFKEIANALAVFGKEEEKKLDQALLELEEEGIILKNAKGKFVLVRDLGYYAGRFIANERGFGFVNVPDIDDDFFIMKENTNYAVNSDTVLVEVIKPKEEDGRKAEARVVKVVKRNNNNIIGKFDKKKLILNPGVISVLIGLPLFIFKIDLPSLINEPISYLATMQTPIAMLIFGTFLAHTKINDIFKHKKILIVSIMKLLVLPAAMVGIYKLFGLSGTLLIALTISSCAPTANNTVMFAAKYNKDTGLAAQIVATVSFISVITMPLIIAAVQSIA